MVHVYMRFACIFAYRIGELEIDHLSFAINASALSYYTSPNIYKKYARYYGLGPEAFS